MVPDVSVKHTDFISIQLNWLVSGGKVKSLWFPVFRFSLSRQPIDQQVQPCLPQGYSACGTHWICLSRLNSTRFSRAFQKKRVDICILDIWIICPPSFSGLDVRFSMNKKPPFPGQSVFLLMHSAFLRRLLVDWICHATAKKPILPLQSCMLSGWNFEIASKSTFRKMDHLQMVDIQNDDFPVASCSCTKGYPIKNII